MQKTESRYSDLDCFTFGKKIEGRLILILPIVCSLLLIIITFEVPSRSVCISMVEFPF